MDVSRARDPATRANFGFTGDAGRIIFGSATFAASSGLLSADFTGCSTVNAAVISSLPPSLTTLILDACKSAICVDDAFLGMVRQHPQCGSSQMPYYTRSVYSLNVLQVGHRFPILRRLSLDQSLQLEPETSTSKWRKGMSDLRDKIDGNISWDEADDEPQESCEAAGESEVDAGGPGGAGSAIQDTGVAGSTATSASHAGWASLVRPRGLFSLTVNAGCLGYNSYAVLREHVTELHCGKISSPAELEAARVRWRDPKAVAVRAKRRVDDFQRMYGADGPARMAAEEADSAERRKKLDATVAAWKASALTRRTAIKKWASL